MVTIACATDDGKHFTDCHFGEADKYLIYAIDENRYKLVQTIVNTSIDSHDHDGHGDALKAKHVMMLMKEAGVQIVANKRFGPNINRIKIMFLPVIVRNDVIEEGLKAMIDRYNDITGEYDKGNDRRYLKLDNPA